MSAAEPSREICRLQGLKRRTLELQRGMRLALGFANAAYWRAAVLIAPCAWIGDAKRWRATARSALRLSCGAMYRRATALNASCA